MRTDELVLSIAQIVSPTEAEGPGRRMAIWFQGCPLRCPGCCNPEFLPFRGGERIALRELEARMRESELIEGITLLGGEPFAHAEGAAALAETAKVLGFSVMVFSGYTLEVLRANPDLHVADLLSATDLLVDGPYARELPDTQRRWIGSQNQRIHFLTDRYSADDPCWTKPNTLEIRVLGNQISVNGFPADKAVGLWKGWKRQPQQRPNS